MVITFGSGYFKLVHKFRIEIGQVFCDGDLELDYDHLLVAAGPSVLLTVS